MEKNERKIFLVLLRIALGWLFFYAGYTKLINPEWSAAGFLSGATSFSGLYSWLGQAPNIVWVDFLNQWGLTLIGVSLIFGIFTRFASIAGVLLMALYYFPGLDFPHVDHGFLVDDHIIYILVLLVFYKTRAGEQFGLDAYLKNQRFFQRSRAK